ncbi:hypothetical protein KKG71_00785 [Patescibacteria group bacterium]|nr:hypothetical protein [Patescibacteria group bacterium]
MKKHNVLLLFFVLLYAFCLYVYLGLYSLSYWSLLSNQLYLIPPLLAVLGGLYAVTRYGKGNPHGRALLYFSLGISALFVGELLWLYYEHILGADPFPSLADVFYIVSYPLMIIGIFKEIRISNRKEQLPSWKVAIPVALLIAVSSFYFIYQAYDYEASLIENTFSMGYGLGDIILVVAGVYIFRIMRDYSGGRMASAWLMIGIGLILTLIADVLFSFFYQQYEESLYAYAQIDLVWSLAYLFFSYGLFKIGFIIDDIRQKVIKSCG